MRREGRAPASRTPCCVSPRRAFLADPHALQTEAFGTVNLVVLADDVAQMTEIAAALEGNLTGCIYSDTSGKDDEAYGRLAPCCGSGSGGCSTTRCRPGSRSRRP